MSILIVIIIFLLIFLMLYGANLLVVGIRILGSGGSRKLFALSAILLALATSLPELSVAFTSGFTNTSSLSLGNVLGANIANLTLVAGGAALLAGRVSLRGEFLRREMLIALLAGIVPLVLLLDGTISRIDGMLLITVWGAYVVHFFHIRFVQIARRLLEEGWWFRFLHKVEVGVNGAKGRELARLLLGVALLLLSADVIVRLSRVLAHDIGIPVFLVGVLVLAIGTTLPELAFSFRSILSGEPTMFFGNILGSIIANSTLIIGVASIISPIKIQFSSIVIVEVAFLLIYLLFWFFIRTKHALSRAEAAILLGLYVVFVIVITR